MVKEQQENINEIDLDPNETENEDEANVTSTIMTASLTDQQKFAGFWMRFWAYLVDLIVIASIVRILVNPLFRFFDIPLNSSMSSIKIFAPITIASAVIFYSYFILMTYFLKQTFGKMIFGLKVVPLKEEQLSLGTIIFREWIGRFISATTWIGYLVVAFLPKKQGIHDLFADTTVIHERA